MAVPAVNPDVTIIHAQQADRRGNIHLWGITGIQKEAVLSAKRAIVTVEAVVESFEPKRFGIVIPSVAVDAACVVPKGAHPSYAHDYYPRDNAFYEAWDPVGRDREKFSGWMQRHVHDTEDYAEYLELIESEGLVRV